MNRVTLVGRLTSDAEIKLVTEEGRVLLSFTLAVRRSYQSQNGESDADFIPIAMWKEEEHGKKLQSYLHKGRLISVEGRLSVRSYENKEGQKRYTTQVNADAIGFLDKGNSQPASNQ